MWHKWLRIAFVVTITALVPLHTPTADKLDELIDSVESVVNKVAEEATAEFRDRFAKVAECQCTRHACGSEFDLTDTCHTDLGDAALCSDCSGQKV